MNIVKDNEEKPRHINRAFDARLDKIIADSRELIKRTDKSLKLTCQALAENNPEVARNVIDSDAKINRLAQDLFNNSATAISLHQPVARDLRFLIGWIQLAMEYERLADHAKNVCKRVCRLNNDGQKPVFHKRLIKLGDLTYSVFREFTTAQRKNDIKSAREVWFRDEEIDDAYHSITKDKTDDYDQLPHDTVISSFFIAKNFERIGDRISNMVEITNFIITGEMVDFEAPGKSEG